MRSKLGSLVLASAALAAVASAAIPAVASTATTLNVPFNFTVEGKSLPAGVYSVQRDTAGHFVKLQGKDASQSFTWICGTAASSGDRVILKFDGLSQKHVLESIQFGPLVTPRLDKQTKGTEDMTPQYMPGQ
jgi:hypothetical protein